VFVPDGKVKHSLDRFEAYAKTDPKADREKRYEDMLDRVAALRLATLRGLWTDTAEAYPADESAAIWWEVWLRRLDGNEFERLMELLTEAEQQCRAFGELEANGTHGVPTQSTQYSNRSEAIDHDIACVPVHHHDWQQLPLPLHRQQESSLALPVANAQSLMAEIQVT